MLAWNYAATGMADGAIVGEGEGTNIEAVELDSYFAQREPPTIIKMDIEKSEADALRGSRELVRRNRPLLAISAYHHPRDLWEIPLLLSELASGYSLYLRHYSREIDDTVCYGRAQVGSN